MSERILLITGDNLEHHYVANKLAAEITLAGIIVDRGKPSNALEKIQRYSKRYTIVQIISRGILVVLRSIWGDHSVRRQALERHFGVANCWTFLKADLIHNVAGINTQESIQLVRSLKPDIILVFGTGIV